MGVLDIESEIDLFVLHCVFLQMINSSLGCFMRAWNLHPLRTESNWSPRKIWLNSTMKYVDEPGEVTQDFGIDLDGPLPEQEIGSVEVPDTVCPLNDDELSGFMALAGSITFHTFDGCISHYTQCKDTLNNLINN